MREYWNVCNGMKRCSKLDPAGTQRLKGFDFHRKADKDGQLTAAEIYLKLGEVSAESGMFSSTGCDLGAVKLVSNEPLKINL